jgi:DNA-binding HxlR family transcriptional regulator
VSGPQGCCPHQEAAIELLSRRHAMNIVWLLQRGDPRRFNEIKRDLGINPVSLCQRLTELEECAIVVRKTYRETPPRVEYSLTDKGRDLVPLINLIGAWARRHGEGAADAPGGRGEGEAVELRGLANKG